VRDYVHDELTRIANQIAQATDDNLEETITDAMARLASVMTYVAFAKSLRTTFRTMISASEGVKEDVN
jgi:hypothetical protein